MKMVETQLHSGVDVKSASRIVAAVFLFGCALAPAIAQAPKNQAIECNASLAARPPLAPLADKVVLSGEAKATLEMQASTSKPNDVERSALSQWVAMRDACFELGVQWMDAVAAPQWLRAIVMQSKDSSDALASALYRGELTYGEFNVKQMALSASVRKRMDDAAEVARREEAATKTNPVVQPPAPPITKNAQLDQYQCEQDAARSYPPAMVQTMTSPGFQAAPRAAQTNCSSFGNQLSCRTAPTGVDTSIYNRPPTYITEDANLPNRIASVRRCMLAKGYTLK